MAIVLNNHGSDATSWDTFKFQTANTWNTLREQTLRDNGFAPSGTPIKDAVNGFVTQWAKPIAHDAKESIDAFGNFANNVSQQLTGKPLSAVVSGVKDLVSPSYSGSQAYSGSHGVSYSSAQPVENSGSTIDYKYADLAKHYGMDAQAAYSEALQNTAYERAVADLKRAGLNPVLAMGKVSPAGSFAAGNTLSSGSGSGASGGYRGYGSGKYALSSEAYNLLGVAGTVAGAILGYKTGKDEYKMMNAMTTANLGKMLFQSAAQGVSSFMNVLK